jgi:hypothetical protein
LNVTSIIRTLSSSWNTFTAAFPFSALAAGAGFASLGLSWAMDGATAVAAKIRAGTKRLANKQERIFMVISLLRNVVTPNNV